MVDRGLPPSLRSDLRFFSYYLGNGTLLTSYSTDLDYEEIVTRGDDTIGRLFALLFSDCRIDLDDQSSVCTADRDRMCAWLAAQCEPGTFQPPELTEPERRLTGFDEPWKDAVVEFGHKLGRGTLAPDVLEGYEYLPGLIRGGSWLEAAVMVYANVLRLDADGRPTNAPYAERRSAQRLRGYFDHDYRVEPPFEEWECEIE